MALPVRITRRTNTLGAASIEELRRILARRIPREVKGILMDRLRRDLFQLSIAGTRQSMERLIGEIPQKYRVVSVVDEGKGMFTVSLLKV